MDLHDALNYSERHKVPMFTVTRINKQTDVVGLQVGNNVVGFMLSKDIVEIDKRTFDVVPDDVGLCPYGFQGLSGTLVGIRAIDNAHGGSQPEVYIEDTYIELCIPIFGWIKWPGAGTLIVDEVPSHATAFHEV